MAWALKCIGGWDLRMYLFPIASRPTLVHRYRPQPQSCIVLGIRSATPSRMCPPQCYLPRSGDIQNTKISSRSSSSKLNMAWGLSNTHVAGRASATKCDFCAAPAPHCLEALHCSSLRHWCRHRRSSRPPHQRCWLQRRLPELRCPL